METQYETLAWQKSKKQTYDYIHLYEYIIPKIVKEEDPEKFYWPSSPSSGGNYEDSNAENVGDTHYWGVWHGSEPFTAYRSHHYRFLSEFGFQSFPALQTVKRFTEDGDRNIFSPCHGNAPEKYGCQRKDPELHFTDIPVSEEL